jgi:hypothetical protein
MEAELREFQNAFQSDKTCIGDWKETCRYVFNMVEILLHYTTRRNWQLGPPWIQRIFRLTIYPITSRDGSQTLGPLNGLTVFVPDSSLLNPLLQHKVNSLDFEGQHIYKLIPLLKLINPPVKFLSDYDNDDNVEIQAADKCRDESASNLLKATKWVIAR